MAISSFRPSPQPASSEQLHQVISDLSGAPALLIWAAGGDPVKNWMVNLTKSAGPKKPHVPPGIAQVAAVSVVVLLAVGAIIVVAQKATPAATASPAKAATVASAAPATSAKSSSVTAKKGTPAKGKTANGTGSAQAAPEIVTITGCLEQREDGFRLKDTGGTDAPKSRSWKTLGLTKHASTVALVDTSNRMKLANHVGERVSVTGPLVDKELQGRSLKSLTPSCD
jgi:hypothetical protein